MSRIPRLHAQAVLLAAALMAATSVGCASSGDSPGAGEPVAEASQDAAGATVSPADGMGADAGAEDPGASNEVDDTVSEPGDVDSEPDTTNLITPALDTLPAATDEPTPGPSPTRAPTPDILATATAVAERRANSGFDVPLEDFVAELEKRVLGRDWTGLATLAADPIAVAPYASEWSELSAGRLVSELGTFYLPEGADPVVSPPETDIAALLGGMDPTAMLGPDVKVARVIHSTGWGLRATDEVLLFISEPPEGGYRWEALLWSSGSFPGS